MTKTEEKRNGTFINHYPKGMIHINEATDKKGNKREFASVSFSCPESKTGYGTFSVNMGQLLPATKKNGDVSENKYSIYLGKPEKERAVSIATNNPKNKKNRKYASVKLTNAQIADYVNTARDLYSETQAASI